MKTQTDNFIGLITVYQGYNYGSSLQAYALKSFLTQKSATGCIVFDRQEKGFSALLLKIKNKTINISKSILIPHLFKENLKKHYNKKKSKQYDSGSLSLFDDFTNQYISPLFCSYRRLKSLASTPNCLAFFVGSDQAWNPTVLNLSKINFLSFSPKHKNISYGVSFGVDFVPKHNRKTLIKRLRLISKFSVRESSGKAILKSYGYDSVVCIDPVLLVGKSFWTNFIDVQKNVRKPFVLLYFLNEPKCDYMDKINNLLNSTIADILLISKFDFSHSIKRQGVTHLENISPKEFVHLFYTAESIITDSFHGIAFSILFNKNFIVLERDYGRSVPQTSRITDLLELLKLTSQYRSINDDLVIKDIDYSTVVKKLSKIKESSGKYILDSLRGLYDEK